MASSVERTLNRWRSFGKLHFAVGRAVSKGPNTPTPAENSSAFLVTFSGERLRNGVKGHSPSSNQTKRKRKKNHELSKHSKHNDGVQIGARFPIGNWMVTVTRVNPPPGLAPTFLSLMTCFEDGNVSEESNTTSIRSTGHGEWERIGHRQFTRSINYFRFDATRNYLGMGRITATVTLSEDGNEFVAEAAVQNYDVSGNLLTTLHSTELGQRL